MCLLIYKSVHKITIAFIAFLGLSIILLLSRLYGIGLLSDSVYYVSVARHIADGTGFVGYDGYNYILQPPLYPFLLAIIKIISGIDPLISAGYFNALLFGLVIYLSGMCLLKLVKSFPLVIIGTVSILISFVFIQIFLLALSETLFILLVLLYLNALYKYKEKGSVSHLIYLSISVALACLTRYVGIILILTGFLSILLWGSGNSKKKFQHLFIYLSISIIPSGIWILRNFLTSGSFVGQRAASSYNFRENLLFFFNSVLRWYMPIQIHLQQLILFVLILSILILITLVLIYRLEKMNLIINRIGPIVLFAILYSAFIIISSTTTAYDKIANRLLSPVFVPVTLLLLVFIDYIFLWLKKFPYQKLISFLFLIAIIYWLKYPLMESVYHIKEYSKHSGLVFGREIWKDNSIINYLNNNNKLVSGYSFFSNVPEVVYLYAGRETKWSPAKTFYNSPQLLDSTHSSKNIWYGNSKICLVWFNNINRNFLYSLDDLKKSAGMQKVFQSKEGDIFILDIK